MLSMYLKQRSILTGFNQINYANPIKMKVNREPNAETKVFKHTFI